MRDSKRIERILGKIESMWLQAPDMRFYQLLINYAGLEDSIKMWNREDDMTEAIINAQEMPSLRKPKIQRKPRKKM